MSDALVEQVRAHIDIVEVCAEHTTLKRSGKTFRGPCPLHGGEGPNFSVDPARGIFKCFVCGEGGDVFAFVMKRSGLDFPSAVRHLAGRAGIEIPERADRPDPHASLREALAFAAEWFAERLRDAEGADARAYLEGRGIEPEHADRFILGFAPGRWRALRDAALERGFGERVLLDAGLLAESDRAEEPYDRFRQRLMFSIHDERDRPVAFGGRHLGPASAEIPKYLNSPESPVFRKRGTLYGLSWGRHSMRRDGSALLVEGYMDVISLHAAGLDTAVASLGTSLTNDQAALLARYAGRCIVLYDSDAAGLRATFRAGDVLLAAGVHPLVVTLPPGEDPDSVVRARGAEALARCLEDAVDVVERKLQILERGGYLETIEGRRRAIDGLLSTLRAARDPALRDLYLARVAERTGVRRETLVREVARESQNRPRVGAAGRRATRTDGTRPADEADEKVPSAGGTRADAPERAMLLLLLREGSWAARAAAAGLLPEHFRIPEWRALFAAILEDPEPGDRAAFLEGLPAGAAKAAATLLADRSELARTEEMFEDALRRLLFRAPLERLAAIDREMDLADEEQQRKLLAEKERLARELREDRIYLTLARREGGRSPAPA